MNLRQKKITESFGEIKLAERKRKASRKILVDENYDDNICQGPILDPTLQDNFSAQDTEIDPFYLAKRALHTSSPKTLPCRDSQIHEVYKFTTKHLCNKIAGSMYISGSAGSGKTAVVTHVLERLSNPNDYEIELNADSYRFSKVFINCMGLRKPTDVFEDIALQLKVHLLPENSLRDRLAKRFTTRAGRSIVLVLDEMDQLMMNGSKEMLYTVFGWTRIPDSKLILIGIANALDLTVRHLPKLFASPKPSTSKSISKRGTTPDQVCHLMNFPPYDKEDIALILEDRLKGSVKEGSQVFDPAAIKFVAMKVAATTGDMRKALSACKLAIQSLTKDSVRSPLKRTGEHGSNSFTPKKQCFHEGETISVGVIAKLLCPQKVEDLPLQQAVILATLLRVHRKAPNTKNFSIDGVLSPIPFDTIYAEHHKICKIGCFSRIESSDIPSYCAQLQDRSLVTIVENSSGFARKKTFGKSNKSAGIIFDPKSVELALRSDTHLKAVLDC